MLISLQDSGEGSQAIRYAVYPAHGRCSSNKFFVVEFYEHLGMKMIRKIEQPEAKFDLYFLGYDSPKAVSHGNHFSDREGLIELTHNYGTENDPNYKVTTGNAEPHRGFGHTCISVDNIQAACQRIEDAGYKFQKKLTDGRMRSIAFALDPDGYWVEIIGQNPVDKTEGITTTDVGTYRMVYLPAPCHPTHINSFRTTP